MNQFPSPSANGLHSFVSQTLPSAALEQLRGNLRALKARVAEEFHALAAILQSNSTRARQITGQSHKATGSEATLQSRRSIGVLQRILGESQGISKMVEGSTENMLNILSHVNATRPALQRLKQMRALLQTVGVMSRIEAARITNTSVDLSGLSKDIDILAKEVHQHVNRIHDDSSKLSDVLQNGVRELRQLGQGERLQTADLVRRTQVVLPPMVARADALQEAAQVIDEQYTIFLRSTDKVVMSLQSEDIARQRVEHVEEAICRVADSLASGESIESCASVISVQRSQLVGTRDLLGDAIRMIHSGLESLGPQIKELVSRTALLAQRTDEDGHSFTKLIDSGLDTVSAVFKQCSSSVEAVSSIVNSVLPSVEKMTAGACALKEIESSIHFISLNAAMRTAQLGSEGVAMGVIAAELRSITKMSEDDTKIVLDGLACIGNALTKITGTEGASDGSSIMSGDGEAASRELADLSDSVRISSQQMADGLTQVRQLADELCIDLERSCALAAGAASITELFDTHLRSFDDIFGQLGYAHEMVSPSSGGESPADLSTLYTMESERRLHLAAFGETAITEGSVAGPSGHGGELDDGVELF